MAEASKTAVPVGTQSGVNGRSDGLFGGHTGSKKGRKKPSRLLADMRWVYGHKDESRDVTQGREICRKLLKEDPQRFMTQLQAMEREHRAGGTKRESASAAAKAEEATAGSAANTADEGTVAVLELIDRLLGEVK